MNPMIAVAETFVAREHAPAVMVRMPRILSLEMTRVPPTSWVRIADDATENAMNKLVLRS